MTVAKFVIVVNINQDAQNAVGGPDMAHIFKWELHHYTGSSEGNQDPLENSGPTLATGSNDTVANAKATAQAYAGFYAQETVYTFEV